MVCFKSRQCNTSILQVLFFLFIIALVICGLSWFHVNLGILFDFCESFCWNPDGKCIGSGKNFLLMRNVSSSKIV